MDARLTIKRVALMVGVGAVLLGASVQPVHAAARQTWGYVGCSNTHDAFYGYQHTPGTLARFWPWRDYGIEGGTVHRWLTESKYFDRFEAEVARYDGGQDPPLIFVQ